MRRLACVVLLALALAAPAAAGDADGMGATDDDRAGLDDACRSGGRGGVTETDRTGLADRTGIDDDATEGVYDPGERLRGIDDDVQRDARTPDDPDDGATADAPDPDDDPMAEAHALDGETGDADARPAHGTTRAPSTIGALRGGPLDRDGDGHPFPSGAGGSWRSGADAWQPDAAKGDAREGSREGAPAARAPGDAHTGASDGLTEPAVDPDQ
jgi:hypothetical protein